MEIWPWYRRWYVPVNITISSYWCTHTAYNYIQHNIFQPMTSPHVLLELWWGLQLSNSCLCVACRLFCELGRGDVLHMGRVVWGWSGQSVYQATVFSYGAGLLLDWGVTLVHRLLRIHVLDDEMYTYTKATALLASAHSHCYGTMHDGNFL